MTLATLNFIVQALTLLAIATGAWQLLAHSRQMHRDFESMYVERYWTIMDRRSAAWILSDKFDKDDRVVARQYLLLCEDEIDLRARGRVSDATWSFWSDAISGQARAEPYFTELSRGADYPALREFLNNSKDPLSRNWLWRGFHGL